MMFATSVQYCHPGRPRRRVLLLLAAGHLLFPWYITMLYRTLAGGGTESWSLILFDHVMLPSVRHHVSPRLRDQRVFAEVLYNNPLALTVS